MKIATILVLINFCFAIIIRASAHSMEERLVFLEGTSQLQKEILKKQQETIEQLHRKLKTQGEIVKTQQGTIDQLHSTLKTQVETVKTLQNTTEQLWRRSKTQGERLKTQQDTIYQLERTLKTQGVAVKIQQNTTDQIWRIPKTQVKAVMHKAYENRTSKMRMNLLVKREADSMKNEQENKNLSQQNGEQTMRDSSASIIPSVSNRNKRKSAKIAFHAYVTTQRCLNDHEIITFDREELDVAGGFNNGDGIYTVPQNGTYVFTWTFVASAKAWYKTELLINGNVKGSNVAAAKNDNDPQSATATIVTSVEAGDHVYVRKASGDHCSIEHVYGRSTFSGWKLF